MSNTRASPVHKKDKVFKDEGPTLVHVYPLFGRVHFVEGTKCWCWPNIFPEGNGFIVVHNILQ